MDLKKTFRTLLIAGIVFSGFACNQQKEIVTIVMNEKQISFSARNHALDNNDNFSPDDRFLCYDTRGTVYSKNLANCKSIEKIEISTGIETVLWEPESVTGEDAAPGVAAVSWHPSEDKVVFIHGPLLEEVEERGYYGIRNRTGVEVSADGKGVITKVDHRDVSTDRPTTPGAQRGGTHRHEYTRKGNRIGFTYDDYLLEQYDRTIGYMEESDAAPEGYTHYFAVLLKPAVAGTSKPGEIEKAYGDSWIGFAGTMRAFIGKVRKDDGADFENALFVADVPEDVDITTAFSGDADNYPEPPRGVKIRRLTSGLTVGGIVRGSPDGEKIVLLAEDENGISQVFVINSGADVANPSEANRPVQISNFASDASYVRWHPSGKQIFAVVSGNIAVLSAAENGKAVMLTADDRERTELVVSNSGNMLAYNITVEDKQTDRQFKQIFVLEPDWERLVSVLK